MKDKEPKPNLPIESAKNKIYEIRLTGRQKEAYLRHQRRILARQRREEGREYMSIIKEDLTGVLTAKTNKFTEPKL